jgi:hypothetical protein
VYALRGGCGGGVGFGDSHYAWCYGGLMSGGFWLGEVLYVRSEIKAYSALGGGPAPGVGVIARLF